jgi:hypothetical protein
MIDNERSLGKERRSLNIKKRRDNSSTQEIDSLLCSKKVDDNDEQFG